MSLYFSFVSWLTNFFKTLCFLFQTINVGFYLSPSTTCHPDRREGSAKGATEYNCNFIKTICCNISLCIYLLFLFVLKQKGTQKFKARAMAPLALPASAQ
jgi:hypothetical protein